MLSGSVLKKASDLYLMAIWMFFPPDDRDPGYFGPWSGKIQDGFLYGRGSCDMKGGDAGVMMAVLFLKKMGFDPKGSVALTWMCDEENGGELGVQ